MKRGGWLAAASAIIIALAIACREPTQVLVEVRLRDGSCMNVHGATISLSAPYDVETGLSAFPSYTCDGGLVGSLAGVPDNGGTGGKVAVRVVVGLTRPAETCTVDNGYDGCVVARRRVTYRAHSITRLPVVIDRGCENEPCTALTTCNRVLACETAEVDKGCDGDACDLRSEKDGTPVSDAAARPGSDGSMSDSGPRGDGGGPGTSNDSGSGADSGSGPGVLCRGTRCPAGRVCDLSGCTTNPANGPQKFCDESSDCVGPGERCCYSSSNQHLECMTTSSCTEDEACLIDATCGPNMSCFNVLVATPFGDVPTCRAYGRSPTVACRARTECAGSCVLAGSGLHSCATVGPTTNHARCDSFADCTAGGVCTLLRDMGTSYTTCGMIPGANVVAEVCDGSAGSCSAGKTCSSDLIEVAFGYKLRVCH